MQGAHMIVCVCAGSERQKKAACLGGVKVGKEKERRESTVMPAMIRAVALAV